MASDTAEGSSRTAVLIVGAGPTGLALAAALARLGVAARTIEKRAARTEFSQALGVQAGTLEALGQFFGDPLPQAMVAAGHPAREGFANFGRHPAVRFDVSQIPSVYNFVLVLPQSETERFLEAEVTRGGLAVERQTELISVADAGTHTLAHLRRVDGGTEQVVAEFVVGCDGAHSTVRHQANIPYAGGAYTGEFVLGDVNLEWPLSSEAVHLFVSDAGILACLPIRARDSFYRLILVGREDESAPPTSSDISPKEFCQMLDTLAPFPIRVAAFPWLARFHLHHRMAERFQSGRLFLAGDAAHIHSPVGGQGMNTGIQDSLSLASKLAAVLRGGAPLGVLADYQNERLPVARAVVRGTDLAFRVAAAANRGWIGRLRSAVGPYLLGSRFIQKRLARTISQVDVARRDIEHRKQLAARYPLPPH